MTAAAANVTAQPDLGWHHLYQPGRGPLTLLLLHGTGGDERQLIGLASQVEPDANLLGVRGRSLEEGYPRFFRRFSATSYDQEQLAGEADELALFAERAAAHYGFDAAKLVLLGYSNGANIALATLLRRPETYAAAVLLRGVSAVADPPSPDLTGKAVLVLNGVRDPYAAHAVGLAPHLRACGADVEEHVLDAGHELSERDLVTANDWLYRVAKGLGAGPGSDESYGVGGDS